MPPAPCTRPPRPTRPPPPLMSRVKAPPTQARLVRFRPDRPRQPELLRQLEERNPQPVRSMLQPTSRPATKFKPYQLKPKRDPNMEPYLEPPIVEPPTELPSLLAGCFMPTDPKKLKQIKKKLDELNRKIRHSRKKHDGLIHKRNSVRKMIEGLKCSTKPEPKPDWTFMECEQAFNGAYRSYRVNEIPKMDVYTFFS